MPLETGAVDDEDEDVNESWENANEDSSEEEG